jgi:hypothetical protein
VNSLCWQFFLSQADKDMFGKDPNAPKAARAPKVKAPKSSATATKAAETEVKTVFLSCVHQSAFALFFFNFPVSDALFSFPRFRCCIFHVMSWLNRLCFMVVHV